MTVKELKHKLRTAPDDARVFMLTDKSEDNYDEEVGRFKKVWPLEYVTRERIYSNDGWENGSELNVLLEIETE